MRKKIISVISLLLCFIIVFSSEATAAWKLNFNEIYIANDFERNKYDSSGVVGELNIVPIQVILQDEEIQMTVEEENSGLTSAYIDGHRAILMLFHAQKAEKLKACCKEKQ